MNRLRIPLLLVCLGLGHLYAQNGSDPAGGGGQLFFKGNGITGTAIGLIVNCSTNVTCSVSGSTINLTATNTSSAAFSALTASTNSNAGNFLVSVGTLGFTGSGVVNANQINGTALSGLATGFLFNTTTTGVPSTVSSTGSGNVVLATSATLTSPTFVTPALGTPASGTLTNATGLPFSGLATASNTTATLTVGSGGSLTFSGTGTVNSNTLLGAAVPALANGCLQSASSVLSWGTCGGSAAFSAITTGSNTSATMTVGTGASLTYSGSGTINATTLLGAAVPSLGSSGVLTNTSGTLSWAAAGSSAFSGITSGTNTSAAMLVGAGASLGYTSTGTVNANQLLSNAVPSLSTGYLQWTGSALAWGTPSGSGAAASAGTVSGTSSLTFTCPSATAGTIVLFAVPQLTGNVSSSTLSGCTPNSLLVFWFQQASSVGSCAGTNAYPSCTVSMPTGTDSVGIDPAANAYTKLFYSLSNSGSLIKLGSSVTDEAPSVLRGVERPAIGTPLSGFFGCWSDSSNHDGIECMNNGSTNIFHMVLGGADINTVVGLVTGINGTSLSGVVNDPWCVGAGNTVVDCGTLAVPVGGTGAATFTQYGVIYGNGASALGVTGTGTTGQPLISGNGSGAPSFAALPLNGGSTVVSGILPAGNLPQINAYSVLGNNTNTSANQASQQSIILGTPGFSDTGILAQLTTTVNGYAQVLIQNLSSGSSASTDFVATANDGSSSTHYLDVGINGSGGGTTPFTNAHAGYVYSTDAELDLGATGTSGAVNIYAAATPTLVATFANSGGGLTLPLISGSTQILGVSSSGAVSGACSPTRAGDICYYNGTSWITVAGNNSGTNLLQENSSGVPSWASGGGMVYPGAGIPQSTGSAWGTSIAGAAAGDVLYYNGTTWTKLTGNNSGTQYLSETSGGTPSWATPSGSGTVVSSNQYTIAYYPNTAASVSGNTGITTDINNDFNVSPSATTSQTSVTITTPASTAQATSTPLVSFAMGNTVTMTAASSTAQGIGETAPTFEYAGTISNAYTHYISGPPLSFASASDTITTGAALYVAAGAVKGTGSTYTKAYGILTNSPSGAATNYALGLYGTTDLNNNGTLSLGSGINFTVTQSNSAITLVGNQASAGGTAITLENSQNKGFNATSGSNTVVLVAANGSTYNPSSGSGYFANMEIDGSAINQSSSASQPSRGLYLVPTLTKAYDYRAIEVAAITWNALNTAMTTTTLADVYLNQNTLASATASSTSTLATTQYIAGTPIAGTNETITTAAALYIDAAASSLGAGTAVTTAYGEYIKSPTGGITNFAAGWIGPVQYAGTYYSAAGTALPSCATATKGMWAIVSDATSPTYRGSYSSGGAVITPVFCDGSSWTTH